MSQAEKIAALVTPLIIDGLRANRTEIRATVPPLKRAAFPIVWPLLMMLVPGIVLSAVEAILDLFGKPGPSMIPVDPANADFQVPDPIEIAGVAGVHMVVSIRNDWPPAGMWLEVCLAPDTSYGPWKGGDVIPIPGWQCEHYPRRAKIEHLFGSWYSFIPLGQ